jgi:flagellar biosynthetic protein FliQ
VVVTGDAALQLMGDTLMAALVIGAPVLGLSMLVGLLVSIVQVVTQIQEMSLTFVPKLIVVAATLIAFGPWMLKRLIGFAVQLFEHIPSYV